MKIFVGLGMLLIAALSTGCASGLNSVQKREYASMEHNGVLIKEKNPTTGAVLGILPGCGSFYARETGLGILNLLLWPVSILWDPVSGHRGSMVINYDITKHELKRSLEKEITNLDEKLALGQMTNAEYILAKRKLEQEYDYE